MHELYYSPESGVFHARRSGVYKDVCYLHKTCLRYLRMNDVCHLRMSGVCYLRKIDVCKLFLELILFIPSVLRLFFASLYACIDSSREHKSNLSLMVETVAMAVPYLRVIGLLVNCFDSKTKIKTAVWKRFEQDIGSLL